MVLVHTVKRVDVTTEVKKPGKTLQEAPGAKKVQNSPKREKMKSRDVKRGSKFLKDPTAKLRIAVPLFPNPPPPPRSNVPRGSSLCSRRRRGVAEKKGSQNKNSKRARAAAAVSGARGITRRRQGRIRSRIVR